MVDLEVERETVDQKPGTLNLLPQIQHLFAQNPVVEFDPIEIHPGSDGKAVAIHGIPGVGVIACRQIARNQRAHQPAGGVIDA